ncbi:MAG: ribbon-helix-helix domain-containing protein [Candidatus Thermoplasmatota archaeon]|jgi:Arc/MetJ-type ribon-helix-helix transcriptional regulator|nr:ribbon-helix-helix domain-containing protein [Candidatus Thermoplasmatota archaeon]MCL5789802.1 ribbon-helix-helix domain-containing protein [Candidatus Thermoplasmatota archaeon]
MTTTQVQVRLPKDAVDRIDEWIDQGKFTSRSDAIKTILAVYEERELTRKFYNLLEERSKEAREKPSILIPLDRT